MRQLDDTQPSRSYFRQSYDVGIKGPPKLLLWGVILFLMLVILGVAGVVIGFREVLQPGQQQRVIDQLPFMRMLLKPTPAGGVFPALVSRSDNSDAMTLLDMPLNLASPTSPADQRNTVSTVLPTLETASETDTPVPTQEAIEVVATSTRVATATQPPSTPTPMSSRPQQDSLASEPEPQQIPKSARIYGIRHQQQTWNNCGPATITMALSYYGWQQDQAAAARVLKPNREDKNVSPHELAAYVEEASNVKAIVRMGGTLELLKLLLANEFPVVIETGAMFEAYDWIGHYRAPVAYDDVYQQFYFFDSFLGVGVGAQGVTTSYDAVDRDWQAFNRTFIVIYEPQREGLLKDLLESHWLVDSAAQFAFETAQAEARQDPSNAFAWFNMGTSLVALERYQEAAAAFDQSRRLGLPWRIMWYQFGAFEAYFKLGRFDDVLSLVQVNSINAKEIEETYYWQGRVFQQQGKPEQAASAFRRALAYNPNFHEARDALANLN